MAAWRGELAGEQRHRQDQEERGRAGRRRDVSPRDGQVWELDRSDPSQPVSHTKVQVAEADMAAIGLLPYDFHGEWNYRKRRDKPA